MKNKTLYQTKEQAIAVVGVALRVPGAITPQRFWQNIIDGRDCLTRFSAKELLQAGVSRRSGSAFDTDDR